MKAARIPADAALPACTVASSRTKPWDVTVVVGSHADDGVDAAAAAAKRRVYELTIIPS